MKKHIVILMAGILFTAGSGCTHKVGVNKNLDPVNQKAVDFMSTKEGSYWQYGVRNGVSYTRYARNKDTVKNTLKYSYYERRDDSTGTISPEYFGKNGDYHITLVDLDGSRTTYLEYAYWKDGSKKGDTWNNTGKVYHPLTGDVEVLMESSQASDGQTMTFGGQTFNNVIHVHCDAKASKFNFKVGTFDIWFEKGIGIIREEANVDIAGFFKQQHTDSLLKYYIVP